MWHEYLADEVRIPVLCCYAIPAQVLCYQSGHNAPQSYTGQS